MPFASLADALYFPRRSPFQVGQGGADAEEVAVCRGDFDAGHDEVEHSHRHGLVTSGAEVVLDDVRVPGSCLLDRSCWPGR